MNQDTSGPSAPVRCGQFVQKRNGDLVPFHFAKIEAAIRGAWVEAHGHLDDTLIARVAHRVAESVWNDGDPATVETIQDAVEVALMRTQEHKVAKAYILFREMRAAARSRKAPDPDGLSSYIHASKYARYRYDLGRRETYPETVARVEDMHTRRFPALKAQIAWAFDFVRRKEVLPSMRTMQFGGAAMEANHCRGYNCAATLIDRPRAFAEALFLLLSGCGVGYSVQFRHVERLPPIARMPKNPDVVHHVVGDNIEGWGDALHALIGGAIGGYHVEFAFHEVRKRGDVLKTSGGRAPGHLPLRKALERVREILLGAQGRKLRPIECHRILCHVADAVLAGGIRRSAMIALFSLDDGEMMHCKSDSGWFEREPWLARANNSVVLKRDEVTWDQFRRIFTQTRSFGEPGFHFVSDWDHACNPCDEAGLDPVLVLEDGTRLTGWSFCNLCEMNAAAFKSENDFLDAAEAATFIGTLQASYTDMPYLGSVTERIVRRDALLGIGMTGMQDAPTIALDADTQLRTAHFVRGTNARVAAEIGINSAARTTLVKPSGTTTLELLCKATPAIGSGIHPHHHGKIIRRVTADELEPPFAEYRRVNPKACVQRPDGSWCIEHPILVGDGATLRDDVGAVAFLEQVRSTQLNWVVPGTARDSHRPGLTHNVSNTVTVRDHEWDDVARYVFEHRGDFAGVSFLPHSGDEIYAFAPFESVKTPEQERRWQELADAFVPVDYSQIAEDGDNTSLSGEAACGAGGCEI